MVRWNIVELDENDVDESIKNIFDKLESENLTYDFVDVWNSKNILLFLVNCKNSDKEISKALNVDENCIRRKGALVLVEV